MGSLPRREDLHNPAATVAAIREHEAHPVGHLKSEHLLQEPGPGDAGVLRLPTGHVLVAFDTVLLDQDHELDPGPVDRKSVV